MVPVKYLNNQMLFGCMKDNFKLGFDRKGITPIIATVLLLGITVAIGLTVYTQAQGMIGNTDTSNIDKLRDTDIDLTPVFKDGDQMRLQVSNKGDRAINVTKFTIYYGPPNFDPVLRSVLSAQASSWVVGNGNKCFNSEMPGNSTEMDSQILSQGESAQCSTGIKFPDALEAVEVRVEADNFDYSQSTICRPESSGARSCS